MGYKYNINSETNLKEKFYSTYSKLPSIVKRYTDPIVRTGIKITSSETASRISKKGDAWMSNKKSNLILGAKKRIRRR